MSADQTEYLRLLGSTLAFIADGVVVVDVEGRTAYINEAGRWLSQFVPSSEANPSPQERELSLRDSAGNPLDLQDTLLWRALRGEAVIDELVVVGSPGKDDTYINVNANQVRDDQGAVIGAFALFRDVTKRVAAQKRFKQSAKAMQEMNSRLTLTVLRAQERVHREQRAELDRLKDQFISNTAHELKTPVTVIKGYAQMLLRVADEIAPSRRKMLAAIDEGADRIVRIINDILDISRLQSGQLDLVAEEVDLRQVAEQVASQIRQTSTKHQVRLVRADRAVVRGDRERLDEVLFNLIDNAIKYSPKANTVDVEVIARDGEAVVSVKDLGVGIPRDKQGRIFERFYRAHAGPPYEFGGMGVGLHICREIVSRHGGKIWFESEEGKGSKFYFSLPLVRN